MHATTWALPGWACGTNVLRPGDAEASGAACEHMHGTEEQMTCLMYVCMTRNAATASDKAKPHIESDSTVSLIATQGDSKAGLVVGAGALLDHEQQAAKHVH